MSDKEFKNRLNGAIELLKPILKDQDFPLDLEYGKGYTNRELNRIVKRLKTLKEDKY